MKLLTLSTLIALMFVGCNGYAQQGVLFQLKERGSISMIDTSVEKIIGDTILYCNTRFNKRTGEFDHYPDKYWVVAYDYGNPPPDASIIMRWYLCEGVPNTYKEWHVKDTTLFEVGPDYPCIVKQIKFTCEKHKSLLNRYVYNVTFTMDEISVKQNMDSTKADMKIKYP